MRSISAVLPPGADAIDPDTSMTSSRLVRRSSGYQAANTCWMWCGARTSNGAAAGAGRRPVGAVDGAQAVRTCERGEQPAQRRRPGGVAGRGRGRQEAVAQQPLVVGAGE